MLRGNPSPKLAITVDPDIHEDVIAAAARLELRRRTGLAAIALWEKEHGRFTEDEMNESRRRVRAQLRLVRASGRDVAVTAV